MHNNELFSLQQQKFGIRFGRSANVEAIEQTFIERLNHIIEHNNSNSTYKLDVNKFAHLTDEELAQRTRNAVEPTDLIVEAPVSLKSGRVWTPDLWDWRLKDQVVRPVQDQGYCNAGWAFAAVGAIEGQMTLRKGVFDKLSEQEAISCTYNSCGGYNAQYVYNFAKTSRGITTSARFPYAYLDGLASRTCTSTTLPRTYGSSVSSYLVIPQSEDEIRSYLYSYGPVAAMIYVPNDLYFYSQGIFTDTWNQCGSSSPNHGVLIVGYGTENQ